MTLLVSWLDGDARSTPPALLLLLLLLLMMMMMMMTGVDCH